MNKAAEQSDEVARYATLQDYLRVLRERRLLIIGVGAVIAATAFAFSIAKPPTYEATVTAAAREPADDIALLGGDNLPTTAPDAQTAELVAFSQRESVARETARALDSTLSPEDVQRDVNIAVEVRTDLIAITAVADDAEFAADLANEFAAQLDKEATEVQQQEVAEALSLVRRQEERTDAAGAEESVLLNLFNEERRQRLEALDELARPVEVVSAAAVPDDPVSPDPVRNTILGLMAGLFLGVIVAFGRDTLDNRLKAPKDLAEHFGASRLGQLGEAAFGRTIAPRNGARRLREVDFEAARIIRTNLEVLAAEPPLRSFAVTSALPGEGKSTVAMALAWASAVAGKTTILLECDLRHPVLANRLGLQKEPGLSDVLTGGAAPREVLQIIPVSGDLSGDGANGSDAAGSRGGLVCVTAGSYVPNPAELLASDRFAEILDELTRAYQTVILDTSPVLSVVDTRELLSLVDGVIVCGRSYQTTREHARATRDALAHFPDLFTGLVVTGVRHKDDDYSVYYSQYAQPQPKS